MGKHATVLEKAFVAAPEITEPQRPAAQAQHPRGRAWSELATRLFATEPRSVIAFGSVHRGAGVTHIVRGVANELRRFGKTVVVLGGNLHTSEIDRVGFLGTTFTGATQHHSQSLAELRSQYDAVLLDCGSLEASTDLIRLAPEADGVVIAVEAGRTSKEQLERASRLITEARGQLLGCVFNKRRYPIPGWLYRML
jgi:Mrp family chromosome partitioning ATPase